MRTCAVVLAAGQGKRMNAKVAKQYLLMRGKPILFYSLSAFENSDHIDEIILVTGEGEQEYCRKEFVEKYGFQKVKQIVCGGKERYHSVMNGLKACGTCDTVLIHDGARPFVNNEIIVRACQAAEQYDACVVGMPVKDTIKIASVDGFIESTPNRNYVWSIQTPQAFDYELISNAYKKLSEQEAELLQKGVNITDDAMVVEYFSGKSVKIVEGSYKNIKITTPEDLQIAETFLSRSAIRIA